MQFYDSDIQSAHEMSDIHSDRDIPKEKLNKPKLLHKTELFRLHKEIRRTGLSYEKPAYYDWVTIKRDVLNEEQYNGINMSEHLVKLEQQSMHIEHQSQDQWIDRALSKMKRDEVSIFILEHLKLDQNGLKILDRKEYHLVQMVEWVTVVDLYQDRKYLKKVLQKGNGNERCEIHDEIICDYEIKQGDRVLYKYQHQQPNIMGDIIKSKNVIKILKTMKNREICQCTIDSEAFRDAESVELYSEWNPTIDSKIQIDISLQQLYKIDDIYHDGVVTKKIIFKTKSTSKADKISMIDFDLWIYRMNGRMGVPEKQDLLYSSTQADPVYNELTMVVDDQQVHQQIGSVHSYIDDIRISKLLRLILLRMKKNELAITYCTESKPLIKNGIDFEGIGNNMQDQLAYVVKVYDFTEGKNNFTMTIDEKIEHAIRKKQIGLKYISLQNYAKALKLFMAINAYFDYGTFSEEDKIKMRDYKLSSLLNTSLCQMKLQKWKDMKVVCIKLLEMDNNNIKIVYRTCQAYKQLCEYDTALQLIKQFKEQNPNIPNENISELLSLQKEIQQLLVIYEKKQKQVYSNLFNQ